MSRKHVVKALLWRVLVLPALLLFALLPRPVFAGEDLDQTDPLEWKWKPAEISEMKKDLKNVKTNEDGTFEFDGPQWIVRTYHTPRFTIQVSRYLELFSGVFGKAFSFQKESDLVKIKPIMTVYPDEATYLKETGRKKGSYGVFQFRWNGNRDQIDTATLKLSTFYQTAEKEPNFETKAPLSVIQHEATHCLLTRIFGTSKLPKWLNEGAASYYQSWDMRKKLSDNEDAPANVKVRSDRRTHSPRVRGLQAYCKQNPQEELPRLDYLTSLDVAEKWDPDSMGLKTVLHYRLAESFMDYLMNSKNRRPFLYAMMQRLHEGQTPIITPQEQLEHEKAWLMFLEEKWGVTFDKNRISQRVEELKKKAGVTP